MGEILKEKSMNIRNVKSKKSDKLNSKLFSTSTYKPFKKSITHYYKGKPSKKAFKKYYKKPKIK
jgi:hypothetical protein